MRIQEMINAPAVTCRHSDNLSTPARLMWEHDCGAVPVTDDDDRIAGMLTDRDICMAAYTQGRTLDAIPVGDVMARQVFSCRIDDTLETAERLMSENRVRRIPVLDADDRLVGVLSMTDIARHAAAKRRGSREFVQTMAAICRPRTQTAGRSA